MRRQDREITDKHLIEDFLLQQTILRVGFWDKGEVYVVPVNYGFWQENGDYRFYFHGARQGRKYELARSCPKVGFEIDGGYQLLPSEVACGYSAAYQSVVGTGRLCLVTNEAEMRLGLGCLMKQASHRTDWEFSPAALAAVAVFRLEVETLSCKAHLP